jgi:hypothetical protein
MTTIEDMLHRRNDLSTFLVHFTRPTRAGCSGFDALKSIVSQREIEARTAYGVAANISGVAESQKVVCFTETPLEHSWTMTLELVERRSSNFAPYGLAFTKTFARRMGCNPVWYVNQTRGTDWPTTAINAALRDERRPYEDPESILRVTPFIEQMGDWSTAASTSRKEFWWEREWRHVGNFLVHPFHTVALLAPAKDHDELRQVLDDTRRWGSRPVPVPLLDPAWGLERMIAVMSGVDADDLGPFPG